MTVVCDTRPLLLLARTDWLRLLPTLYSTIAVLKKGELERTRNRTE